jgi:hypothetical protein
MLRKLAGNMEASAAQGQVPYSIEGYIYTAAAAQAAATVDAAAQAAAAPAADPAVLDELAGLRTEVADLKAAKFNAAAEPERKTLAPSILSLLAKADITMPEGDAKLKVADLDAAFDAAGTPRTQRMAVKQGLMMAGKL